MPSFTLSRPDVFPSGTTVTAYPASNWSQAALPPSGAPVAPSAGTAGTATDTSVTMTGLTEDVAYYAYGLVSAEHRYVRFVVDTVRTADQALSERAGQAGFVAPQAGWLFATGFTAVALRGGVMRFCPTEDILVTNLGYTVLTAAGANDNVDVGIYNELLTTRLGSSGAVGGKLNVVGTKSVPLTAPVQLRGGIAYYAALSFGALGGTAAVISGVGAGAVNSIGLFGFLPPQIEFDTKNTVHPLPAAWGALGFAGSGCPLVTVRDS